MQGFPGNISSFPANYFSHCLFFAPGYFAPQIPLYPATPTFQSQFRLENQAFPQHSSSLLTNTSANNNDPMYPGIQDILRPKNGRKGKKVESQDEQQEEEEQFKIRQGKSMNGGSFSYKKKNTESNVVNQAFSFLCLEKSQKTVAAFFKGNMEKSQQYYRVMAKVKQVNKKYINRIYLKRLMIFKEKSEFQRAFLKAKVTLLTVEQMRTAIRALLFNFLRQQVNLNILTSCKIYKETLPQHFWRRREILKFLFVDNEPESTFKLK